MTRPSYDLGGKVVLITGGTGGIGSATARELLRRGAKVAIVDVDPDTPQIAARMSSHSAMGAVADVRVRATLDLAVADVVDRFGRIDVAIANAGILSRAATLRTTPTSSIESLFAVNVTGVINTVQAAMDQVIAHRGQFVLISSVFAFLNGMGTIPYAMSKAAVEQLGRGLRVELADARRLDDDRLLLPHRHQHDQTRRRRRPHRRRTPRSPAAGPAQTPPTRRCRNSTRRRPHSPFAARHGAGPVEAHLGAAGTHRPRTGSTSGPQPTNPGRTDRTRRTNPHRTMTTQQPRLPATAHDHIERQDMTTWKDAPNRTINVDGVTFAYRELGTGSGVPVVFLHHLTAVLDDWDPRIIDGIAAHHRVIAFDNRGVGATGGSVPPTVEQMGADAIAFIRALGLEQVDLFGFSLGGGVAQMVALQAPELVRRMILAGTGPRGGGGIDKMATIVGGAYAKAALTLSDPRNFLFFPRTPEGKKPHRTTSGDSRNAPTTATRRSPTRPASPRSRPSGTPDRANPTTSRSSPSPSSSPTATTTSWSTAPTPPTWHVDFPTPS